MNAVEKIEIFLRNLANDKLREFLKKRKETEETRKEHPEDSADYKRLTQKMEKLDWKVDVLKDAGAQEPSKRKPSS